MIKKILPISVFVLVIIIIILLGLQNLSSKNNPQSTSFLTPTLFKNKDGDYTPPSKTGKTNISTNRDGQSNSNQTGRMGTKTEPLTPEEFQKILPIKGSDFSLGYSDRMEKYIVTLKNDDATASYDKWINQNPSYANELKEINIIKTKQTIGELHDALNYAKKNKLSPEKQAEQEVKAFTSAWSTLINIPFMLSTLDNKPPTPTPTPLPTPTSILVDLLPTLNPTSIPLTKILVPPTTSPRAYKYYSQCDGPYDESPLPQGCTICDAGCGPTSLAMILSSYISPSLSPPVVVQDMATKGVRMGCEGSYIYELYTYLKGRGDLTLSDFIISPGKLTTAQDAVKDYKGYIDSGWTLLVLANFKTDGGGHYFWVTNISEEGDIFAYDPYYGKLQAHPINENRYAPAPYYRYAFAIKKTL